MSTTNTLTPLELLPVAAPRQVLEIDREEILDWRTGLLSRSPWLYTYFCLRHDGVSSVDICSFAERWDISVKDLQVAIAQLVKKGLISSAIAGKISILWP